MASVFSCSHGLPSVYMLLAYLTPTVKNDHSKHNMLVFRGHPIDMNMWYSGLQSIKRYDGPFPSESSISLTPRSKVGVVVNLQCAECPVRKVFLDHLPGESWFPLALESGEECVFSSRVA